MQFLSDRLLQPSGGMVSSPNRPGFDVADDMQQLLAKDGQDARGDVEM